jgi:6-phospho-beta-glucosidase
MKIAIVGGGSTYTPEVMDGFIQRAEELKVTHVALQDIDPVRLKIVGDFCIRMAEHAGVNIKVTPTLDLDEALAGADFVLLQFRVGGQKARHADINLGLRHGLIGQETVGVGGFGKALRTIPEVLKVCERIEKVAPKAFVINFTNPSGIITQTILNHTGVRGLGLCNVPIEMKMAVAKVLEVPENSVSIDYVGLNHLHWVRGVKVDGNDITEKIMDFILSEEGPTNIPDLDLDPWLIRALKAVPLYYARYYYYPQRMLDSIKAKPRTRAQEVMDVERRLLEVYKDESIATKPKELEERGGAYYSKIAVDIIASVANNLGDEHIVNVRNEGALPDLAHDAVIEIPATVDSTGATPISTEPLEPSIRAMIQTVKAYEELTVAAAMESSWDKAALALITNPIGPTADNVADVLDDIIDTFGLPIEKPNQ